MKHLVLLTFLCDSASLRDASAAEPAPKPNIVLLYIDDWARNGSQVAMDYSMPPTFVDWMGGDPQSIKILDGVSPAGNMRSQPPDAPFLNRSLYFHYPHYWSIVPHPVLISGSSKVIHFYGGFNR